MHTVYNIVCIMNIEMNEWMNEWMNERIFVPIFDYVFVKFCVRKTSSSIYDILY